MLPTGRECRGTTDPAPGFRPHEQSSAARSGVLRPVCRRPGAGRNRWRELASRARLLGHILPRIETTDDPALRVVVNGRLLGPIPAAGDRYIFVMPATQTGARLVSRATCPTDLTPWVADRRNLGVAVSAILLRNCVGWRPIAIDDPALRDGWWNTERDRGGQWRWTTGNAHVPFTAGLSVLEIELHGTIPYIVEASEASEIGVRGARSRIA